MVYIYIYCLDPPIIISSKLLWLVFPNAVVVGKPWAFTQIRPTKLCGGGISDGIWSDSRFSLFVVFELLFGCFLKWWYPQNTPKWSFLVGTPIVVGYHHFRKPLFGVLDRVNYVNLFGKIKVFMKTTCHFFLGGNICGTCFFFFQKKVNMEPLFFFKNNFFLQSLGIRLLTETENGSMEPISTERVSLRWWWHPEPSSSSEVRWVIGSHRGWIPFINHPRSWVMPKL